MKNYICNTCGGRLERLSGDLWKCPYCGSEYQNEKVLSDREMLRSLLDEYKEEKVANLRRNLYDAINEKYTDSEKILSLTARLKEYLPDDFMAGFFDIANSKSPREVANAINATDAKKHSEYLDTIIGFMLKSFCPEFHLPLANLIERAYKNTDLERFEQYSTRLSDEAEKFNSGVNLPSITRDCFIAYSSKDMDKVYELVSYLEESGLTCFVAARNLRHGRGAVQNYKAAIEEAIRNCRVFVFVSSENSRSFSCDALSFELPCLRNIDISNAPPEYKQIYSNIPDKYKRPRVEYRLQNRSGSTAADDFVGEIFDGCEYALSPREVARRVIAFNAANTPVTPRENPSHVAPDEKAPADVKKKKTKKKTSPMRAVLIALLTALVAIPALGFIIVPLLEGKPSGTRPDITTPLAGEQLSDGEKYEKALSLMSEGAFNSAYELFYALGEYKDAKKLASEAHAAANGSFSEYINEYGITEYTVPSGVTELAEYSFGGCTSLTKVILHDGISSIGRLTFKDCPALTEVVFPTGITFLPDGMFNFCYSLAHIEIPKSVTAIGNETFWGCSALTDVQLNEDLESIGKYAFESCTSLKSIVIPNSVTFIGEFAFSGCSSLEQIALSSSLTKIENNTFNSCSSLESITLPEGVTSIGAWAFSSCVYLENVTLPQSLTEIKDGAFNQCETIRSISIPDGVNSIGSNAFAYCHRLAQISLPVGVTVLNNGLFNQCIALSKVDIKGRITKIGNETFMDCSSLIEIALPESLTSIGKKAFSGTTPLNKIAFGGSREKWNAIEKGSNWREYNNTVNITCTNGSVTEK